MKFGNDSHSEPQFLLNFDKWKRLYIKAREALFHHAADVDGNEAVVALLRSKLGSIRVDSEFDKQLEDKSSLLRKQERAMAAKSKRETDEMGWS
jgi:hypothetical protein